MVDTHLRIKPEIYNQIKANSKKKGISFNEECNRLLELSILSQDFFFSLEEIIGIVKRVDKNCYVTKRLLEQTYSDIGLNITDVNKSKNLKEFYKGLKGRYND